jgi:predicted methyltransferase
MNHAPTGMIPSNLMIQGRAVEAAAHAPSTYFKNHPHSQAQKDSTLQAIQSNIQTSQRIYFLMLICALSAFTVAAGCASTTPTTKQEPTAAAPEETITASAFALDIVAAPDRDEADRALDAGRKPAEFLTFAKIKPGMRVAEIAAGGGYTAELLARAVGAEGTVWGQNNAFVLERFAEKPWTERLKKPVMAKVVRVNQEFDDPFPPDVKDLDVVTMLYFYHDTVWQETDRAKMNAAIFNALKPGGYFVVLDHSAAPGAGLTAVKTLHRIEESIVRDELLRAGFVLDSAANFLRHPDDTRDWNAAPSGAGEKRGTSDRFALRFMKPTQ